MAHELAACERIVFVCGRYEGVDERVNTLLCDRELSIGDYVLSGGELAAAVILDSVVRASCRGCSEMPIRRDMRVSVRILCRAQHGPGELPSVTPAAGGLLDYPQYTQACGVPRG